MGYELLVGLSGATNAEPDDTVRGLIKNAQIWTVISWLTYPVVYILPMLGFSGAQAVVGIQVGYCVSDIIQVRSRPHHLPCDRCQVCFGNKGCSFGKRGCLRSLRILRIQGSSHERALTGWVLIHLRIVPLDK